MLPGKGNSNYPWREAGPPKHHEDKVDSDQQVVDKELSLCRARRSAEKRWSLILVGECGLCSIYPSYCMVSGPPGGEVYCLWGPMFKKGIWSLRPLVELRLQCVNGPGCWRWRSNPSGKCSQERLTRGTVISTMRRAAHPSGCARCGAGAGSEIQYQSLSAKPLNPKPPTTQVDSLPPRGLRSRKAAAPEGLVLGTPSFVLGTPRKALRGSIQKSISRDLVNFWQ